MAKIAVDIDNTLYSFDSEIREAFFEMAIQKGDKSLLKGAYSGFNEWRELADVHEWPIIEEAIDWVHERQGEQTPFKGSVRVVNLLAKKHELIYISSRKEQWHIRTEDWLCDEGYPDGGLICSGHDKSEYLKDCQYLIDDRPATIINFLYSAMSLSNTLIQPQRKAFGLWTPYNRNLTDIKNILLAPTWRGIEFYLERKDVL